MGRFLEKDAEEFKHKTDPGWMLALTVLQVISIPNYNLR